MPGLRNLVFIVIVLLLLVSCRTSQTFVSPSSGEANTSAYINKYKDLAVSEMKRTGVPASITLAQGMIESDFGRSRLAREANNHFGIKCHSDWKGSTITHNDDRRNECFRKYSRPEESFYDHSDFLRTGSRYRFLFDLKPTDYKGWARGLRKAGYATNPDYADMLIRKIEENNLFYFDTGKAPAEINASGFSYAAQEAGRPLNNGSSGSSQVAVNNITAVPSHQVRIMENNRIQYVIAKDGETREFIEKEFGMLRWELSKYNELPENFTIEAGQLLYLQPKRDKAEPGREVHTVTEGETLYDISQKYGVKLKSLIEFNRFREGVEPAAGDQIWLRGPKPVR